MKTKPNFQKKFFARFIFSIMMILMLAIIKPTQAQGPFSGQDQASLLESLSIADTIFSRMSSDTEKKELIDGQNKKAFGHNVQLLITILREPFISKRSRKAGPYDVIIVPGIPFEKDKDAGMIMKARVKWASYLVTRGIAKNVIFSGSAVYTPYTESRIMALYAIELGIPAERIYC
jgi:hypothetical protein